MVQALFIWGIIQSLLIAILIPIVRNIKSNYLLSLILFTTSINISFQYFLRFTDLKYNIPQLLVTPDFLDLLLPTLIYLYLVKLFKKIDFKDYYPYFILPVFWAIVLIGFVLFKTEFHFYSYINTKLHLTSESLVFLWKAFLLYKISGYYYWSHDSIKNKQKDLLRWPRTLIIFMGLITLVSFFNLVFFLCRVIVNNPEAPLLEVFRYIGEVNYIIFTCCIIIISIYFFTKQPQVLAGLSKFQFNKQNQDLKKYDDLYEKLMALEKQKLILDIEFNEIGLAEKLGVKSYILSKFLNERLGKSFIEYINEKRIEEAKNLLQKKECKDWTMYAIALDSGFKSESSFYSNFKKQTGMTPNQFRTEFFKKKS